MLTLPPVIGCHPLLIALAAAILPLHSAEPVCCPLEHNSSTVCTPENQLISTETAWGREDGEILHDAGLAAAVYTATLPFR
jgi:hypothetical protein